MSRNVPNVNASLIREVRMIAQQLMRAVSHGNGGGRSTSYNDVLIAEAQAKAAAKASQLKCAVCLANKDITDPRDALTIANGDAVCGAHLKR